MIYHTLFVRFGTGAALSERDAAFQSLIALYDRVGAETSFACGPDVDTRSLAESFTHAFEVVFGSLEAFNAFRSLPDYATAVDRLSRFAEAVKKVVE